MRRFDPRTPIADVLAVLRGDMIRDLTAFLVIVLCLVSAYLWGDWYMRG